MTENLWFSHYRYFLQIPPNFSMRFKSEDCTGHSRTFYVVYLRSLKQAYNVM